MQKQKAPSLTEHAQIIVLSDKHVFVKEKREKYHQKQFIYEHAQ